MEKHQFKPFDKVVVKNHSMWTIDFFAQYNNHDKDCPYCGISASWEQCLPYNEETARLIGTTDAYILPQPKEYHVWTSGSFNEWMTEDEFQNFIKTAVIHNKDITDFHVLRIKS